MHHPDMGFRKYDIDLILCGHEHHYQRSLPIRGWEENTNLARIPSATATDVIDTTKGTAHTVIGGRTSVPANPPQCGVITSVGAPNPAIGERRPVYVKDRAPWSSVRNAAHVPEASQPSPLTPITLQRVSLLFQRVSILTWNR
jgi:hypothetical protein